jgi:hypothetical protein
MPPKKAPVKASARKAAEKASKAKPDKKPKRAPKKPPAIVAVDLPEGKYPLVSKVMMKSVENKVRAAR